MFEQLSHGDVRRLVQNFTITTPHQALATKIWNYKTMKLMIYVARLYKVSRG